MPSMMLNPCPTEFEVTVEVPRWAFAKRNLTGRLDFISPLPSLFNYGAIPKYVGLDGDYLDALVVGPRLSRGTTVHVKAYGAIGLTDRGLYDDKLICSVRPLSPLQRALVLNFFRAYAVFKKGLNLIRRRRGPTVCEGWCDLGEALGRARPRHR